LSKRTIWNLVGEPFDPDTIPADTEALKDYYRSAGFFDVEVTGEPLFSLDRSSVCLVYTLTEGRRYTIREILCEGNKQITSSDLLGDFALKAGDHYNAAKVAEGVRRMRDRYIQADDNPPQINPIPRFNEEKGILDLVLEIEETEDSPTFPPSFGTIGEAHQGWARRDERLDHVPFQRQSLHLPILYCHSFGKLANKCVAGCCRPMTIPLGRS
jgi:hypothetical protein